MQLFKPYIEALSAVASRSHIRKLTLDYRHCHEGGENDWTNDIPVEALGHVTDLTLVRIPTIQLVRLKSIVEQSTTLRTLDVYLYRRTQTPLDIRQVLSSERSPSSSLDCVRIQTVGNYGFSFPAEAAGCMRNLTALSISIGYYGDKLDQFWKAMRIRGVRLQVLEVSAFTRELVKYLASYTGLRHLKIGWNGPEYDRAEALQLADDMYDVAIRSHDTTLTTLGIIEWHIPGEAWWGINEHRLKSLVRARKLRSLDLVIDTPDLSLVRSPSLYILFQAGNAICSVVDVLV